MKAPYFLVAELAPLMAKRGKGAIVNLSTMVADYGAPGMSLYGASKAAINLLTKTWAAEYGPKGVRVNAVSPGPTRTEGPRVAGSNLVVTLGDSLFSDDGTLLEDSSSGDLNRLVTFLDRYPDRTASITGYTDDTGTDGDDQARSERSADSVMSYLIGQGISPGRLSASGMGDSSPVATNESAFGRQQNRRVEVAIHAPESAQR